MSALLIAAVTAALTQEPECAIESRPATIVRFVVPTYPSVAAKLGATGTSVVGIDLSSDGSLLAVRLLKSSGNSVLDYAAIKTASAMEYGPEIQDCEPVSGSYSVEVDFPS